MKTYLLTITALLSLYSFSTTAQQRTANSVEYMAMVTFDEAKAMYTAWLVSDDADYITGETLYIDGGMMLYPEFADNG